MKLKISEAGGKFRITDDEDHVYGTYDNREKAETNMAMWLDYFAAPLVF